MYRYSTVQYCILYVLRVGTGIYLQYPWYVQYVPVLLATWYPEFRQLQYQSSIVFLVRLEVSVFCPKH